MTKEPIAVTGIMIRNLNEHLIVEAEIEGKWVIVIMEWVGPMEFAISHIVEPIKMKAAFQKALEQEV